MAKQSPPQHFHSGPDRGPRRTAAPTRHRSLLLSAVIALVAVTAALTVARLAAASRRRPVAPATPATPAPVAAAPAPVSPAAAAPTPTDATVAPPHADRDAADPVAPPVADPGGAGLTRPRVRAATAAALVALVLGALLVIVPRPDGTGSGADGAVAATTTPTVVEEPPRPDCTELKCVVLTFDDGPDGVSTPRLLDILEEHGATATFFVLGYAIRGNEDILRRMDRLGMGIENHTWDHPDLSGLSRDGVLSQLARTDAEIRRVIGRSPTYMRPPYGAWTPGSTPTGGMRPVIWETDPQDWLYRNSATVAANVLGQVGAGDVILLHDIHQTSVEAVPAILEGLERGGYTLVTLDDLYAARPDCPVHLYCAPATTPAPAPGTVVTTTVPPEDVIRLVNEQAPA